MRLPTLAALLTIAAALVLVAPASAANVAPNPGFENVCDPPSPTKACSWYHEISGVVEIHRDTSTANSGAASYKVRLVGAFFGVGGTSDCMAPPSPGLTPMSFWYRTTDARINNVNMIAWQWDTPTCNSSASGATVQTLAPIADGAWHQLTGASNTPPNQGFTLELGFSCSAPCAGAQVNYDDVVFGSVPTVAAVASIHGVRTRSGVLLRWRTAQESAVLGFNVYRRQGGKLIKLNRKLIPSVFGGTTAGHAYSWLDRRVPRGNGALRYRLQSVSLDGSRRWVGAATVAR